MVDLFVPNELPVDTAGQLLVTAGNNPHRLRSEAAFARLCGAAPIPVSSGRTDRHRLHRGGDRLAVVPTEVGDRDTTVKIHGW